MTTTKPHMVAPLLWIGSYPGQSPSRITPTVREAIHAQDSDIVAVVPDIETARGVLVRREVPLERQDWLLGLTTSKGDPMAGLLDPKET